jgi:hypothetical protein
MHEKPTERGPATALAIAHKATLKPDHQTLLDVLLADAGMGTATLETLVEHLFEEEDPRLLLALRRAKVQGAAVVAQASARTGASVGSLRRESAPSQRGAGSVGSLRRT